MITSCRTCEAISLFDNSLRLLGIFDDGDFLLFDDIGSEHTGAEDAGGWTLMILTGGSGLKNNR